MACDRLCCGATHIAQGKPSLLFTCIIGWKKCSITHHRCCHGFIHSVIICIHLPKDLIPWIPKSDIYSFNQLKLNLKTFPGSHFSHEYKALFLSPPHLFKKYVFWLENKGRQGTRNDNVCDSNPWQSGKVMQEVTECKRCCYSGSANPSGMATEHASITAVCVQRWANRH